MFQWTALAHRAKKWTQFSALNDAPLKEGSIDWIPKPSPPLDPMLSPSTALIPPLLDLPPQAASTPTDRTFLLPYGGSLEGWGRPRMQAEAPRKILERSRGPGEPSVERHCPQADGDPKTRIVNNPVMLSEALRPPSSPLPPSGTRQPLHVSLCWQHGLRSPPSAPVQGW
jgi:hypothetical protein